MELSSSGRHLIHPQIKKERQSVALYGIDLEVLRGDEIPDALFDDDIIFSIYVSTIEKLYYG